MNSAAPGPAKALYVHVPFCARACPYCDFDFVVDPHPAGAELLAGLERELGGRRDETSGQFSTVYVGGGTPSALATADLARLCDWVRTRFDLAPGAQWTVEINPEHVVPELLTTLRDAGVGRVSLGVQSLDRSALRQLGRAHDGARAGRALRSCSEADFQVSADLIVGWPGQQELGLRSDIEGVLSAGAGHVSIYALTIEPDTGWIDLVARGARSMPDPRHVAEMLTVAEQTLSDAGLAHYEVASYARPGQRSAHNVAYWRWRDYVGLGPSACSCRYAADGSVVRRANVRGFRTWLTDPTRAAERDQLDGPRAAAEGLWLGLRVLDGFDVQSYLARFPQVTQTWLEDRVARQVELGNLRFSRGGKRLSVAPSRWLFHDRIAADLL